MLDAVASHLAAGLPNTAGSYPKAGSDALPLIGYPELYEDDLIVEKIRNRIISTRIVGYI